MKSGLRGTGGRLSRLSRKSSCFYTVRVIPLAMSSQRPLGRKGAPAVPAANPSISHERVQMLNTFLQTTGKEHAVAGASHVLKPLMLLRGYHAIALRSLQLDDEPTEVPTALMHNQVWLSSPVSFVV